MSVFRKTLPVLATSFINKCGTIGMSLLPMLLVEKHFSSAQSALAMTAVKASLIFGVLCGGWCCDRIGLKRALILSFVFAGVGLGFLPFAPTFAWVCALGVVGQIGQAMARSPLRLLLTETVPNEHKQESIGWLRTANNLGQIISYSIGSVFTGVGLTLLMLFDSITSFAAAAAGTQLLPGDPRHRPGTEPLRQPAAPLQHSGTEVQNFDKSSGVAESWSFFWITALILAGFVFLYDLFMIGAAARCKLRFGDVGLSMFSRYMMVNTVFCTIFAVYASRAFRNPTWVLPLGVFLVALGSCLFFSEQATRPLLFVGMLSLTAGEIFFTAMGTYILLRVTPSVSVKGSLYSVALTIESLGQILAGALAFPLVVHGAHPVLFVAVSACFVLALCLFARRGFAQIHDADKSLLLSSEAPRQTRVAS